MRPLRALLAAAITAFCCAPAGAEITILKADGSEAGPGEASLLFNSATGGWDITLSALYAPGGFTRYDIHGDGGETIDNIYIDVPCLEGPTGDCLAGSPVIVKVLSDEPDGIATVHNIIQTGTAETILNRVDVRQDIGAVQVEDIGILEAGRDVVGPICATIADSAQRGITDVIAQRHILGDITADDGRIIFIVAYGAIGAPETPVVIRAKHRIVQIGGYEGVYADINSRYNGGAGGMYGFGATTFIGTLETQELITNPYNGNPGRIRVLDHFQGTISIGRSFDGPDQFMEMPPQGLCGQIIINADSVPGGAWSAPVYVGPESEPNTVVLNGPGYPAPAADLGGGSVGLVPFRLHEQSCEPVNGGVLLRTSPGDGASVRLRHYGPLSLAGSAPVTIERRATGTAEPYLPVPLEQFDISLAPDDANTLLITSPVPQPGFEAGFEYRITPAGDLRCATPGEPPVQWISPYLITVEMAAPACPADLDGSGAVDVPDLLAVLAEWGPAPASPADLDGNGVVDVLDLLALLAEWGPC